MSKMTAISQGEDLDFVFDLDGEDITGWICTMEVKIYPSDTALISRVIPPDLLERNWPGSLTSAETSALAVSSESPYWVIGVLTNSSTGQERQIPRRFSVGLAWAS